MKFSVDRSRLPKIRTPSLFKRLWKVDDLGDLEERKGNGSQMVYGER